MKGCALPPGQVSGVDVLRAGQLPHDLHVPRLARLEQRRHALRVPDSRGTPSSHPSFPPDFVLLSVVPTLFLCTRKTGTPTSGIDFRFLHHLVMSGQTPVSISEQQSFLPVTALEFCSVSGSVYLLAGLQCRSQAAGSMPVVSFITLTLLISLYCKAE